MNSVIKCLIIFSTFTYASAQKYDERFLFEIEGNVSKLPTIIGYAINDVLVYDSLYVRYTLVDTNVVGFEEFLVDTASDTILLYNTGRIGLEKQICDTGCVTAFDILTNSPLEYMLIDCREKGHFIDERIYYDPHGNPVKSVFYKHGEIYRTEEY